VRRAVLVGALAGAAALGALALPASASAAFTPLTPFGGSLRCPQAVGLQMASDGGGALQAFVGDPCNATDDLLDFTIAGALTGFDGIGTPGGVCGDPTDFMTADGIAVDPSTGDIYVTDRVYKNAVLEFNPEGDFLAELGGGHMATGCAAEGSEPVPEPSGSAAGYFSEPTGLAIDGADLLVADPTNGQIQKVPLGFSSPIGDIDVLPAPAAYDLAVDPNSGDIFVTAREHGKVDEYSGSGTFMRTFASGFEGTGFATPEGIAVDPVAHVVYVADFGNGDVDAFDEATGAPLSQITGLSFPAGLAVDPVNHVLYVADAGGNVTPYSYSPPPTCGAEPLQPTEVGMPIDLTLDCRQPDDDVPVTYAIDGGPSHGVLSGLDSSTGAVTYAPDAGFTGFDSFTYVGTSADGTSAPVTVTIDVAAFSELSSFAGTIPEPSAVAISPDGAGAAQSVWVTAQGDNDVEQYTPDGRTLLSTIPSTFICQETNETFDDPFGLAVDPATGDLYVSDSGDGRIIEFDASGNFLAQAGGGEISGTCGTPTSPDGTEGIPTPGYFDAPQALTTGDGDLWVVDGGYGSLLDTVPLGFGSLGAANVLGTFDPASVAVDNTTGNIFVASGDGEVDEYDRHGNAIGVFADGFDGYGFADGGGPNLVAVDPIAGVVYVQGALDVGPDDQGDDQFVTGIFTYDEATGAPLQELVTGLGASTSLAVDPVNHVLYVADDSGNTVERFSLAPAPSCTGQPSDSTAYETSAGLSLSCTDSTGAPVTYSVASNPAHGMLSGLDPSTGAVTYTPNAGYSGLDRFTFDGSSENGTSQPETVTVDVAQPPAAAGSPGVTPTCAPQTLSSAYETALPVTLACSAGSSATPQSYAIVSGPSNGTVSKPDADGSLTYTPDAGFVGSDSFTFDASYDGVTSAPQTVTIYVGKPLPAPVLDKTLNAYHAAGFVYIYLPGQHHAIRLVAGAQLPDGSVIDTDDGRVGVFVAVNTHGASQHGDFYGGTFRFTQTHGHHPLAVLRLLGAQIIAALCAYHPHSFGGTFPNGISYSQLAAVAAKLAKKAHFGKPVRQLWGHAHGNFQTVGNGSSASVRGTRWAIFDYPDGTLTFVYQDTVAVYDFHLHKTVYVTAGHFYFAALGTLPPC
jgi:DNA-binding beta-propeller fold protein YncE